MKPLLEIKDLHKSYVTKRDLVGRATEHFHAVDGLDLEIHRGETLAVVGESGAGKSTVGRLALRLIEPDSGSIVFDGMDLRALGSRELRRERSRIQMIFQDPYSSLDQKMTIGDSVAEPLLLHEDLSRRERDDQVWALLDRVGIRHDQMDRYPYELSGGQLQRVAIARAVATRPDLIVCDEPVAALDVSIRAHVINLLRELQAERDIALLFISHDLSLVRSIAHRIAIMYAGKIVEYGPADAVFQGPRHPYTRRLLAAIPEADPDRRTLLDLAPVERLREHDGTWNGCAFYSDCPRGWERCESETPMRQEVDAVGVACHLYDEEKIASVTTI